MHESFIMLDHYNIAMIPDWLHISHHPPQTLLESGWVHHDDDSQDYSGEGHTDCAQADVGGVVVTGGQTMVIG